MSDVTIEEIAAELGTDIPGARAVLEYWQGDVAYLLSKEQNFATLTTFPRELAQRVIAKHRRQSSPNF